MPRKQRDYKAEYARRIQLGKERAEKQGVPFERSLARGHVSQRAARAESLRIADQLTPINGQSMRQAVEDDAKVNGWPATLRAMRAQQRSAQAYYRGKRQAVKLPDGDWSPERSWYHGIFG